RSSSSSLRMRSDRGSEKLVSLCHMSIPDGEDWTKSSTDGQACFERRRRPSRENLGMLYSPPEEAPHQGDLSGEVRRREAAIAKRLDQQDRRLARLEHDGSIGVETLALFIRFWLNTTPPFPEPAAKAASAQAGARCDNFIPTLGL